MIKEVRPWQRECRGRLGTNFVFLADEFYLRAGLPLPGRAHYGDYPQIEDGVGMVRRFIIDTEKTLKRDLNSDFKIRPGALNGTVVTGELFYPILSRWVNEVNERCKTKLTVVGVSNKFFGEEVTVAGLISGSDVLAARRSITGDFLLVPEQACLKSGNIFLDDLSLDDLEDQLQIPVSHGGSSLSTMISKAKELEVRHAKAMAVSKAMTVDAGSFVV